MASRVHLQARKVYLPILAIDYAWQQTNKFIRMHVEITVMKHSLFDRQMLYLVKNHKYKLMHQRFSPFLWQRGTYLIQGSRRMPRSHRQEHRVSRGYTDL